MLYRTHACNNIFYKSGKKMKGHKMFLLNKSVIHSDLIILVWGGLGLRCLSRPFQHYFSFNGGGNRVPGENHRPVACN